MAGGIGSFCINMGSGRLFDDAAETNMTFMGFEGKPAGYFIIFCVCAVAYLEMCIRDSLASFGVEAAVTYELRLL